MMEKFSTMLVHNAMAAQGKSFIIFEFLFEEKI